MVLVDENMDKKTKVKKPSTEHLHDFKATIPNLYNLL